LLGFAFVDVFHTLRFELDWQRTTPALESAVLVWGSECLVKTGSSALLYATSHEADESRLAFLDRQGFDRAADHILHLERSLAAPISVPRLPTGFTLRPVEGEVEAAELAMLHRQAFGTPHMTTERRLALMRGSHYDPALDLVILTAEGVRAAYGMGSINPGENALTGRNECYADLFATHPDYRGHGLARAILVRLLQRLQARGFATAKLNTSSENLSMQRVAVSEGFQVVSRTLRFARAVDSNELPGSR
jgi:ribosomal protein S18 acetylase RimI-like enzyme